MFKGLKNKLEDEQRDDRIPSRQPIQKIENHQQSNQSDCSNPYNSKSDEINRSPNVTVQDQTIPDVKLESDLRGGHGATDNNASINSQNTNNDDKQSLLNTIDSLKQEVLALKDQLNSAMRDKIQLSNENVQFYDLVDKLKRNLDSEKELNSMLQSKLNEAEASIKQSESRKPISNHKSITISNDRMTDDLKAIDDVDILREKVHTLQNQLVDKNRQLKIRQQNMNDIKKALQKEFMDHAKTQEELAKVRNQLATGQQSNENKHNGPAGAIIDSNNQLGLDRNCSNIDGNGNNNASDRDYCQTSSSNNQPNSSDNSGIGYGVQANANQLDRISYYSHSSAASVDDYDSNDQNREVNHEYLRNVLYRYMTSTDSATTQHLVKAISLIMNFTPEQYATIKSAMHSRLSWLRLK